MKAFGRVQRLVLQVGGESRRFELEPNGEAVVIGRAPDAQVKLETPLVSRRHCAIRAVEKGLEIRDLGSLNGTHVNGARITTVLLADGDVIRIGESEIAVGAGALPAGAHCHRCGRLASMATLEDGGTFEVGEKIVCANCRSGAHLTSPTVEKRISETLEAEGFDILARISPRTTSAPVFKARRKDLDDVVALKVLPITEALPEKRLERFKAEARVMAQVKHPNVVSIYEVRHRPALSLLVMEFIPGETLLQRIERKKRLGIGEALRHAIAIAGALEAAGKLGVVHRNVKPSNVMIERGSGEPRLIDFGLARNLKAERPGLTDTTTPLGTIRYMAPEQMRDPHAADGRSDIYSLAATVFHALTGKLPHHERNELELLQAAVDGRPLAFDLAREQEIPQELKNILACALMLDPADRQPNATVLLEELRAFAAKLPKNDDPDSTRGTRPIPKPEMGTFAGDQLVELVRVFGVNGRSGMLEVKSGVRGGHLVFHEGRVIEARTLAGVKGASAAHELLDLWKGDWFFKPGAGLVTAGTEPVLATHTLVVEARRRREMLETHQDE